MSCLLFRFVLILLVGAAVSPISGLVGRFRSRALSSGDAALGFPAFGAPAWDRARGLPIGIRSVVLKVRSLERAGWPEVCRLAREASYDVVPDFDTGDLRSAAIGGGCRSMLTSWAALLNVMAAQSSGAPAVLADIQQLYGLTEQMDSEAFLPLRLEELGLGFARRMRQLPGLIDDATDRARELGWVSTEGLARTPWATGCGRYIQLAGVNGRLDVNFDYWAERGDTPV